jgi:lipopolysaccharide biosynthesis glycosyltransferase
MERRNAVVVVADERQFPPAVFLVQRLRRLNTRADVDIILASQDASLLAQATAFDSKINVLDLSAVDQDRHLPVPAGYITKAAYLRLFLPALLAGSHRRMLYLDVDTYPESRCVFDLFDLDMRSQPIAAVRDLNVPFIGNAFNTREIETTLKITGSRAMGAKYFNSGVTLFDIDVYVEKRLERKTLALLSGPIPLPQLMDQTLLNAVLRTNWVELSPAFNMIPRALTSFVRDVVPPAIVHFTSEVKPWHQAFAHSHPVKSELTVFLADSPWRDFIARANAGSAPRQAATAPWGSLEVQAIVRYLRDTPFADAKQGYTNLNFAALSPNVPVSLRSIAT